MADNHMDVDVAPLQDLMDVDIAPPQPTPMSIDTAQEYSELLRMAVLTQEQRPDSKLIARIQTLLSHTSGQQVTTSEAVSAVQQAINRTSTVNAPRVTQQVQSPSALLNPHNVRTLSNFHLFSRTGRWEPESPSPTTTKCKKKSKAV